MCREWANTWEKERGGGKKELPSAGLLYVGPWSFSLEPGTLFRPPMWVTVTIIGAITGLLEYALGENCSQKLEPRAKFRSSDVECGCLNSWTIHPLLILYFYSLNSLHCVCSHGHLLCVYLSWYLFFCLLCLFMVEGPVWCMKNQST